MIDGSRIKPGDVILGLRLQRPAHQRLFAGAQNSLRTNAARSSASRAARRARSRSATNSCARTRTTSRSSPKSPHGIVEGPRAHHRRRPDRQPAARPARRLRRRRSKSAAGKCRPFSSTSCRTADASHATRCIRSSTWASAWRPSFRLTTPRSSGNNSAPDRSAGSSAVAGLFGFRRHPADGAGSRAQRKGRDRIHSSRAKRIASFLRSGKASAQAPRKQLPQATIRIM